MRPPPGTAPEAFTADEAPHAEAACAACGITLETRLHEGRIVDVYRARLAGGARIAAKLTRARWRQHRGALELIDRERRILASVDHPHIVRVMCGAERGGAAVLGLEYLSGGDLVSVAGAEPKYWLPAALGVLSALDTLRAAGTVHGDVKARNVLFDKGGAAKLIDFGSALPIGRPLASGGRTRAHEPLRFEFKQVSPAQDLYAFAVLLYELWTGRLPFGPAPTRFTAPRPFAGPGAPAGIRALEKRVIRTLEAEGPCDVGTLLEFADVLESVHA